jgi:hypothetical protein
MVLQMFCCYSVVTVCGTCKGTSHDKALYFYIIIIIIIIMIAKPEGSHSGTSEGAAVP